MKNQSIKQLKEVLDQKGIKYTSKDKKEDLVRLLEGKSAKSTEGKRFSGEH